MFILRGLFWFGVVALLMPQSPNLGLGTSLDRIRDTLAVQHDRLVPTGTIHSIRGQVRAAQGASGDFVGAWRQAVYARVNLVRADLGADRAARNGNPAEMITLRPRY